jgi:dihydroorotate dehydrogenase
MAGGIELAPGGKQGLLVANPVLLAGGMIGYGELLPRGLDLTQVGAAVIGPFTATARAGRVGPRYGAGNGGIVVDAGGQSRGVDAAVNKFAKQWQRLPCPVVAQIVAESARETEKIVARLQETEGIVGLELAPGITDLATARSMVTAALRTGDRPVWVKVRLDVGAAWAGELVEAGAQGIVVGQPPRGRLPGPHGGLVAGEMYGLLVFALMLDALVEVAQQGLPAALVACGGIHTFEQMETALAAGAQAVQIDGALWVEPGLPNRLAAAWSARAREAAQAG